MWHSRFILFSNVISNSCSTGDLSVERSVLPRRSQHELVPLVYEDHALHNCVEHGTVIIIVFYYYLQQPATTDPEQAG